VISTFPFCFSLLRSAVVPLLFFSAIFLSSGEEGFSNEGMKGKGERRVSSDRGLGRKGMGTGLRGLIHFFCTTKSVNSGREQRGWGERTDEILYPAEVVWGGLVYLPGWLLPVRDGARHEPTMKPYASPSRRLHLRINLIAQ
jgi:hypothetical protein